MSIENCGDRFITSRSNLNLSQYNLAKENDGTSGQVGHARQVSGSLSESLFATSCVESTRILACKAKAPEPRVGYENRLGVLYSQSLGGGVAASRASRHIPSAPERILDAPDLLDDYYLNLLDWSKDNRVAVALGSAVYVWSAESGEIMQLCERPNVNITSVQWAPGGQFLAIGNDECEVQLWDVNRSKQVRKMSGHSARVSALAWNGSTVSSAGRDTSILNHDVRLQQHVVSTYEGHKQEVCGLTWSHDGQVLASGGNDNLLFLWDQAAGRARFTVTDHGAAVKALAWCPFANDTLATGAGTTDPSIRFYNTSTGACLNTINTGAQVCSLQWSRHYKEIVSSHGWTNNLCVWKYPSMVKSAELSGHTSRVLHTAQSPDGTTIVSAGDETLRFWKVWQPSDASQSQSAKLVPKSLSSSRPSSLSR